MAAGWLVEVEVEAGRGELEPLLYAVALNDHRDAMTAAQNAPEVMAPRILLGGRAPPVHRCVLIGPLRSETIQRLGLQFGNVWKL